MTDKNEEQRMEVSDVSEREEQQEIAEDDQVEIISDSPEETTKDTDSSIATLQKSTTVSKDENDENGSDSDNEEQGCPICFEPWSNSGSHRLASLNCGHLFGRSCIERWLKGKATDKCPQCNCPAKRKDIRNIYCKTLKVIDTTERDRAYKELEEEKTRRARIEEEHMRTKIQFEMARAELERLKEEMKQQAIQQQQQLRLAADRPSSSQQQQCTGPSSSQSSVKRSVVHQKTIQIAQNKARVMTFDGTHAMMAISKPSPNQLFPGYGVVKVSSLESRSSEYVSLHQNTIRDVSFNSRGDRLLLSASMDKTIKITSMTSNTVVQSYTCPFPVWCCQWNDADSNFVYSGLSNGHCLVYDIRNTDEPLKCLQVPNGISCPIVSIAYVPKCLGGEFSAEGLLIGTLNGGWFWELCRDSQYIPHPLNLAPGTFTGITFDETTRHCMASYRPSKYFANTRHVVYKMSGSGVESSTDNSLCTCSQVKQLVGGNISKVLSRSTLFTCVGEEEHLFAAAGDEASNSTLLWDCDSGAQMQKLPSSGPVLDVLAFNTNGSSFISTLTEQRLSMYRWE